MDKELRIVIEAAWKEWQRARDAYPDFVPDPSAPVLWFGNLQAFLVSPRRIITIGVNPGPNTFPPADAWVHYPNLQSTDDPAHYVAAMAQFSLNGNRWFNRWNGLLEPLDARYGHLGTNGALHLDLSPIATNVGFAYLPDAVRRDLLTEGLNLLSKLLKYLTRDAADPVCFLSVRQDYADFVWRGLGLHDEIPWQLGLHSGSRPRWGLPGELLWLRKTGASPVSPGAEDERQLGAWMAGPRNGSAPRREMALAARDGGGAGGAGAQSNDRMPAERAVTTFVAGHSDYVQLTKNGSRHDFLPAGWQLNGSNVFERQAVSLSVAVAAGHVKLKVFLHMATLGANPGHLIELLHQADFPMRSTNQAHQWFWPREGHDGEGQEPVPEEATDAQLATALERLVENFEHEREVIEQCLRDAWPA